MIKFGIMPVIKSAIKKLRKDRKREKANDVLRKQLRTVVKKAAKAASNKMLSEAFSSIDKAVKKHLIHKNRAARMKSALAKSSVKPPKPQKVVKKTPPKARASSPAAV